MQPDEEELFGGEELSKRLRYGSRLRITDKVGACLIYTYNSYNQSRGVLQPASWLVNPQALRAGRQAGSPTGRWAWENLWSEYLL